jgi:hypothetical protein
MIGLIQKLMFQLVKKNAGEEAVLQIKQQAGVSLDSEFEINQVYSDEEWRRILSAVLKVLNCTEEELMVTFGDYFLNDVTKRFPTWVSMSKNSFELLSIQPRIHNCFATSIVDKDTRKSITDKFRIESFPNHLITHYSSPNQHCILYIYLAKKVIAMYGDEAIVEEKCCQKKGAPECEIHITWTKLGN